MGYRAEFVRKFGELFACDEARAMYESHGVESMEMDEETEIVTVHFRGGGKKEVNVAMDSLSAIAYDIIRRAL